MPLPYPELLSSRVKRPHRCPLKLGANLACLVFSFLHLGSPSVAPAHICKGAALSPVQHAALAGVEPLTAEWNVHPEVSPEDMGRAAAKVESVSQACADLLAALGPAAADLRSFQGCIRSGHPKRGNAGNPGVVVVVGTVGSSR